MGLHSSDLKRGKRRWHQYIYIFILAAVITQSVSKTPVDEVQGDDNDDDYKVNVYNDRRVIRQEFENENNRSIRRFKPVSSKDSDPKHRISKKSPEVPSVNEFPPDFLTDKQRHHGGILLHVTIATYACIALAIVCDYYFIPSLENICYRLNIQEDVVGATLVCIGSSAPNILSSIIAIMFVDEDLGVGTVMGTAVFNMLLLVGVSGIVAYENCRLMWWPYVRETVSYFVSIIVLVLVLIDMLVNWWEAAMMVTVWCLYNFMLWQNKRIEKNVYLLLNDKKSYEERFEDTTMKKSLLLELAKVDEGHLSDTSDDYGDPIDLPDHPFELPECRAVQIISWIVILPIKLILFITIPDFRRSRYHKCFAITFVLGAVWIGVLTYILMWMVTTICRTLGIPDSIMGITFVTIGTSVPDFACSIVLIRRGKADMAISNANGSNVLSILIGLGLSWLIKSLALSRAVRVNSFVVLPSAGVTLLLSLVALLIMCLRKFVLDKRIGITLVTIYMLYLAGNILLATYPWKAVY